MAQRPRRELQIRLSQRLPHAGKADIIRCLLDAKANVEDLDSLGRTPLHAAARQDNDVQHDIVHLLLEAKASVHKCDGEANTPLLLACSADARLHHHREATVHAPAAKIPALPSPLSCSHSPHAVFCAIDRLESCH